MGAEKIPRDIHPCHFSPYPAYFFFLAPTTNLRLLAKPFHTCCLNQQIKVLALAGWLTVHLTFSQALPASLVFPSIKTRFKPAGF